MDIITASLLIEAGQSIACFSPGDMIIRVKSVEKITKEFCPSVGAYVHIGSEVDHSCRLTPVKFLGVLNNIIYVRELYEDIDGETEQAAIMDGLIRKFRVEDYSDNWSKFELPKGVVIGDILD